MGNGGITKGKSHKEGGIPMEVKSTGQKVELEGGEGVINKRNMSDTKKHDFDGKQLTKCEIASEINSDNNNGVEIECDDITGKQYKYKKGGATIPSPAPKIFRRNLAKKYAPSLTGAAATFVEERTGIPAKGKGLDSDSGRELEKGGDVSDESDTPKIYVADLRAYNEGRLVGKWIDLTDYDDGDEVGEAISELMEEYSKKYHGGEETEHAIHDYEHFDSGLYSEYMGNKDFNLIIQSYKVSEDMDIPVSVITEAISGYNVDADDIEDWISDNYHGIHDSDEDLAYDYVEQIGGVTELGDNTLESYFDYGSFGRDMAYDYNSIQDSNYNTHYFRQYEKGGEISTFAHGGRTNTETAETILKQLGGVGRLKAFTGAKNFINHGNGVSFKIGNRKFNYVKILLTPMDLYDMTFMKLHGGKMIREEKFDGIYNDMLVSIFESTTGMYLSFENGGEVSEFAKGGQIEMFDSFEKGGATYKKGDFFQRRWLLSDYGYKGKKGTEIKVVKEGDSIILGEPIGTKLTDFQKERLPYEYEAKDTSVLPVYEHTNPITNYKKGGKIKRYSSDGKMPNNDFQKIELPKWIGNILDKEYINFVNIFPDQLEIDFFDKGFMVGDRDIKAIEKKGYAFDSINTYGTSGIMLIFTKKNKNK